jgi:adenylate cyclase
MRESARRGIIRSAERERGQRMLEVETVVCFVDLVGFTSLGAHLGAEELGAVATKLADLAADLARPPVRLVKTIGDGAMFVSLEAAPTVATALALVDAAEEADLPSLRAGVALGPAFSRAGDWYGNTVNLASRVTGVARPGSVLATQQVRDDTPDDFSWSFAGRFKLKGVPDPVALHRARRAEPTTPRASRPRRPGSS